MGWAGQTGGRGTSTSALAEGFLAYYNYYDNQVYCVGKGPSATTVSASPKVVTNGAGVLIEGMVTDQSPGAMGTPAISDADMGEWMEYLYMQKPKPTDAAGVQVTLSAVSPTGGSISIGTVTSDAAGMFKKMWTPPSDGEYTIIATFEGSESYWTSVAQTAIGVSAEPTPEPSPTPFPSPSPSPSPLPSPGPGEPAAPINMYLIAAAVAVVAVIVAAAIFLRKRK